MPCKHGTSANAALTRWTIHAMGRLSRRSGKLSVYLDGTALPGMSAVPLADSVSAVGWRPWRNSIEVRRLQQLPTALAARWRDLTVQSKIT